MKNIAAAPAAILRRGFFLCFAVASGSALAQPLQLPKLQPPHGEIGPALWERRGLLKSSSSSMAFVGLVALFIGWLRRSGNPPWSSRQRCLPTAGDLEALRGRAEKWGVGGRGFPDRAALCDFCIYTSSRRIDHLRTHSSAAISIANRSHAW